MQGSPIYAGIHLLRSLFPALFDRSRPRATLRLAALPITHSLLRPDRFLSHTRSATDVACGCCFFGRKRESAIPDRVIISMFRER